MHHYTEVRPGEIFVGNTKTEGGVPENLCALKTIRLGDQALDIDGNELDPGYMRPLFIHESEAKAYDRIMMKRTFPDQHYYG